MDNHIQVIARAVIIDDGHILLTCGSDGVDSYTYLPGGHVELSEPSEIALLRELTEELGVTDASVTSFLGTHESVWRDRKNNLQHEINLIFAVTLPSFSCRHVPTSMETHISFTWARLDQLAQANLMPIVMRTQLPIMLTNPQSSLICD